VTRLKAPQRPAFQVPPFSATTPGGVDAIVARAICPAVATGPENRIVAWNPAFAELAGGGNPGGSNLQELLRCRHPNGNLLSRGHSDLHEMVLSGEAPAAFEVDIEPRDRPRVRVEISIVVVLTGHDAARHRLVYMMRPRHRRRRSDTALEQLLNGSTPALNRRASDRRTSTLTRRQLEVLGHLATGATASEIAVVMGISTNTVRTHIRSIFETLEVTRQTEAVAKAVREGLI